MIRTVFKLIDKNYFNFIFLVVTFFTLIGCSESKKVNIFFDPDISQITFAAHDIKTVLETKAISVSMSNIRDLPTNLKGNKVVLLSSSETSNVQLFVKNAGELPNKLEEQAFSIRTLTDSDLSYWIIGGDANGTMYGGLQLAEDINFYGLEEFNIEDSPDIKQRGIKFNIPFDKRSPTYYGNGFSENNFKGTAAKNAIANIWDIKYWEEWFDQMARYRFNAISMWSLHPFTSMIKLEEYPEVAIQDVEGFDGFSKKMSIDEKISFWQEVMRLGKNRGFEFYIYNWNIYTYGATGKYGIDNDPHNEITKIYTRKCISRLFETYPNLNGFGVTAGENTGRLTNDEEVDWVMDTYGQGIIDFAKEHLDRNIVFIQRFHDTNAKAVVEKFQSFVDLPNVRLDFSFKYAVAHIYSTTTPNWIRTRYGDIPQELQELNKKTWLALRNDDFYYLHWGNPDFVKEYLSNIPDRDKILQGFFMGPDGYTHTRVFNSKAEWAQDLLEIERHWYTFMLWGRLGYNLNLSNEVFMKTMANKYRVADSPRLFEAWSLASKGLPLITELFQGTWKADWNWWPEACHSLQAGFRTIDMMIETVPPPGSNLCSIRETAENKCGDKPSALEIANLVEEYAIKALSLLGEIKDKPISELETNEANIKAMSLLSLYYAEKIRGAVYKASNSLDKVKPTMEKAAKHWLMYIDLMENMYSPMDLQRCRPLTDWHMMDSLVIKEFEEVKSNQVE
jgi:hypothetical protein